MKESTTYQGILEEGRQEGWRKGVRQTILRLGRQKFGPPRDAIGATLTTMTDLERLERMIDRILIASSWDDLLATP
jgi:hypothetical protein